MATTPVSESTDGPVLSVINKRLRSLKKKLNRIVQTEESQAQGKLLNKEQEEVLRSRPYVVAAMEELEKLRAPIASALAEEINLAVTRHHHQASSSPASTESEREQDIEDLVKLLYFGSMFDVKGQNDFTSTMLTRTHERGCCLTYDYVTDDESSFGDLLSEKDLDSISALSGLVVSRPVDSSLSHKEALRRCVSNATQWLLRSDHPIDSDPNITYAGLRAKLNKIMASDYVTTTPEMKATVEMAAAAAGNYASFQVPVHESMGPVSVPVHVEGLDEQYQLQKDVDASNFQGNQTYDDQSSPVEESQKVGEFEAENSTEVRSQTEVEEPQEESLDPSDMESKEQQYAPRRNYPNNQRGGRGAGGGRRGYYPNGRGARGSSRGGGPYQNGRNQFFDHPGNHPGNYYPRNYYSNRGRGGRGGGGGGNFYSNHTSGAQATNPPAES
ncbi:hypothetical protein RHGRI_034523 [Rhododendron griersonianum]|uniref:Glycine-rich protein n=1 Tax=Rhododendron griersonianum TaxID=479676 RepID=A0AAV6I1T0_9ERIC|nr:hypothetical protein RHGRI_034523 [Rhododendron griersonianum]